MKNIRKWQQGLIVLSLCFLTFNAYSNPEGCLGSEPLNPDDGIFIGGDLLTRHIVNNGPQPWTWKWVSGNGEKMFVSDLGGDNKCNLHKAGDSCTIPAHTTYTYSLGYNGTEYSANFQFFDHNGNQESTGADDSNNGSYHLVAQSSLQTGDRYYWFHNGETGSAWLNSDADGDFEFIATERGLGYFNGVDASNGAPYASVNIPRAEIPNSVGGCVPTPSALEGIVIIAETMSPGLTEATLFYQFNGDLVLQGLNGDTMWQSNTGGKGATNFCWQYDGNMVIYNENGPIWSTGTDDNANNGDGGGILSLQLDCNLVIYSLTGNPLWSTGTMGNGWCETWEH